MKSKLLCLVAMLAAMTTTLPLSSGAAAIINNGNSTFIDTATGYVWMDISTFYNESYSQDRALLLPGFVFATPAQVNTLELDTGLTAATSDLNFISIAAAMGVTEPTPAGREVIWGTLGDGGMWAFIYGPESPCLTVACAEPGGPAAGWSNESNSGGLNYANLDMGGFAIETPLPQTLPLFSIGLGVMGVLGWRRRRTASAV